MTNGPWFVESPFYSSGDEELNDKAFHELKPTQKGKNERLFIGFKRTNKRKSKAI